jgi:hypothetical protein
VDRRARLITQRSPVWLSRRYRQDNPLRVRHLDRLQPHDRGPQPDPGDTAYTFASWSDGGAQLHNIVVPATAQTYAATFSTSSAAPIGFVQVKSATPKSPQSTVTSTFNQAQTAGNLNVVVAIGWNESVGNIASVSDSAGNVYQVGAPTFRGDGLSQAIYYAKSIVGAGTNTVTVRFDKAVAYADIRVLEYSGLDRTSPLDVISSSAGTSSPASSGTATTNFARELVVGAGMTSGGFTGPGPASPYAPSPLPTKTSQKTAPSPAPEPIAPQPP